MKLEIALTTRAPVYQPFLEADLNYLKWNLKRELHESLRKLDKARGGLMKIFNLLKRHIPRLKSEGVTFEMFRANLEMLEAFDFVNYKVRHEGPKSFITLEVNEWYFQTVKMLRIRYPGAGHVASMGMTKRDFLHRFEREFRKTYALKDRDFSIEEAEEPETEQITANLREGANKLREK